MAGCMTPSRRPEVLDLRPVQICAAAQLAERGRGLCRGRGRSGSTRAAAAGLAGSRAWRTAWRRPAGSRAWFINDSKATNPDAAARALASFERIYWIAGGRPKQASLEPLLPWLERVRHAYLIGEAAAAFEQAFGARVRCTRSGELETAVAQAAADAALDPEGGAVVLLAPACASFDQFADFEARGEAFSALAVAEAGAA